METRRMSLLGGMISLLGATLLLCFGRSFAVYVIARLLQGISSAVVWIVGQLACRRIDGRSRIGCRYGWRRENWPVDGVGVHSVKCGVDAGTPVRRDGL